MLLAFSMEIILFIIEERVNHISNAKGHTCPVVERYASKRSRHPI
jgi:hypothetical protein